MARKKIETIESLGSEETKLLVQKSLPLFSLWKSDLTLAEFKILDTYLSRIDSHKPNRRTVTFEKEELEKLLGVKRIRTEELDERLKHLGTPIRIDDKTSKNKKFARVSLFEKSVAEQDENGLWQVELTASQSAMKYFFNVEKLGYLRYKLRCITSLTSRYSYILFAYLEENRFRKSWQISVDDLKVILNCENEESYSQFKVFNDRILKRSQKEIQGKTECKFSYKPIRKGRNVTAIEFEVETLKLADEEQIPGQMTFEDLEIDYDKPMWYQPISKFDFTEEEWNELDTLICQVPNHKLPEGTNWDTDSIDFRRTNFTSKMVAILERKDKEKSIKNKFAYLKKMIENEMQ